MDGKYEYEQAQGVNHYRRFDGFESAYEDYVVGIVTVPSKDTQNNNIATKNYAKQNERPNQDLNHIKERVARIYENPVTRKMFGPAILVVSLLGFGLLIRYFVSLSFNSATYYLDPERNYKMRMTTQEYGIEFYVKSIDMFNNKYPQGTPMRAQIEDTIEKDYIQTKRQHCTVQLWLHSLNPENLTPDCDKLQSLGMHI